jgi:hypothetical protein
MVMKARSKEVTKILNDVGTYSLSLGRRTFYVGSMFTWAMLTLGKLHVGYAVLSVCV